MHRRLPTVPPVKKTESYAEELADFDSYIDEQERKMSQQSSTNKSSARDSSRPSTQKRYINNILIYKNRWICKQFFPPFFFFKNV